MYSNHMDCVALSCAAYAQAAAIVHFTNADSVGLTQEQAALNVELVGQAGGCELLVSVMRQLIDDVDVQVRTPTQ